MLARMGLEGAVGFLPWNAWLDPVPKPQRRIFPLLSWLSWGTGNEDLRAYPPAFLFHLAVYSSTPAHWSLGQEIPCPFGLFSCCTLRIYSSSKVTFPQNTQGVSIHVWIGFRTWKRGFLLGGDSGRGFAAVTMPPQVPHTHLAALLSSLV